MMAIATAAKQIVHDGMRIAVGGGVESISIVQTEKLRIEPDPGLLKIQRDAYMAMLETAEIVAKRYGIAREAQDAYALASQQRTAAGAGGRRLRCRDRAGHDAHEGRGQGDEGGELPRGHAEQGRGQPARHQRRRARRARPRARSPDGHDHRRQREPAFRRRRGAAC